MAEGSKFSHVYDERAEKFRLICRESSGGEVRIAGARARDVTSCRSKKTNRERKEAVRRED
jgi:hypothetical protein